MDFIPTDELKDTQVFAVAILICFAGNFDKICGCHRRVVRWRDKMICQMH